MSSNFDDKLNYSGGELNKVKAENTLEYFNRVVEYLQETPDYKWLTKNRNFRKVLAVINVPKKMEKFQPYLFENKIEILKIDDIIMEIVEYLDDSNDKGLKIQNQTLRILQLLKEKSILSLYEKW